MGNRIYTSVLLCLFLYSYSGLFVMAGEANQTVVATGVGINEDEANRQAYRNAIQQVVGTLIVAETVVENDQLIRDKILSHSGGYISEVKQIGNARSIGDGLVEVTIKATVVVDKLRQALKTENVSVTTLDGQSLFAEMTTKQEKASSLRNMIKNALEDIPTLIKADAKKPKMGEEDGVILLPVTLSIDEKAYLAFCKKIEQILDTSGFKFTLINGFEKYSNESIFTKNELIPKGDSNKVFIVRQINKTKNDTMKIYCVDNNTINAMKQSWQWLYLKISFKDDQSNEVAKRIIPIESFIHDWIDQKKDIDRYSKQHKEISMYVGLPVMRVRYLYKIGIYCTISPRMNIVCDETYMYWSDGFFEIKTGSIDESGVTRDVLFKLNHDQVKNIRSIQCSVFADDGTHNNDE